MATIFLESGGDSDFGTGFWTIESGTPAVATDFVHGSHVKSYKYPTGATAPTVGARATATDAGGRFSFWIYLNVLPSATSTFMGLCQANFGTDIVRFRLTSGGILQLTNGSSVQIGSNGSTLSTGQWYRITFTWKITSTTVNQFATFMNGNADITVTNTTLGAVTSSELYLGNASGNASLDMRSSDHYIDNSNSLADPGNIWVTAKRPVSNGTTVGFTTQIGSGGSGYGTGHTPQVNERPNSNTNGWSVIGAGSAITEEYNIEGQAVGDINISGSTIVDYMGWICSKALVSETAQIIVNGVSSNVALTSTIAFLTKIAGSSTYPAGTGSDIGEISSTALTTVSLYEAGIIVAYIPSSTPTGEASWLSSTVSQPIIANDISLV